MSLQPRNTKIMRREGPWGQAGWFRSRYLTLTDATAGRLRVAQPPGVAGCEHRELAIVLELSCVCARVCARVKVKPSMSVGVTGTKIVLVCLCPWGSHKQEGGADIPAVDGDGHRWLPYPLPETQLPWPVPARLG